MPQGYGGGGHAVAGAIGAALLWAVAASLVGQVYLLGLSLVYLRVTEGLDLSASEAALRATFDDAKRRTAELGERARQAAHRDGSGGASASAAAAAATTAVAAPGAFRDATDEPTAPFMPAATEPPATASPDFASRTLPSDDRTTAPTAREVARDLPDIALPFDEPAAAAPPPPPSYSAPPAWAPPPTTAGPVAPAAAPSPAALPPAPPLPPPTTCPQCLSSVTPEDVFCGVCGYRLK
jgi:hypothetical protein